MNIVVEGPDGSGKSSLCALLSLHTGRVIVGGEGPSKAMGEFDMRARRLLQYREVIFDRHPVVSGPIYSAFREGPQDQMSPHVERAFYASRPFFIYCHPTTATTWTNDNEAVDTPEYQAWLKEKHEFICTSYELWALAHAHVVYRVGDDEGLLINALKGVL